MFEDSLAAGGWIPELALRWQKTLSTVTQSLSKEMGKLSSAAKLQEEKEKLQALKAEKSEALKKKAELAKAELEKMSQLAQKLMDSGHQLRETDLSEEVQLRLIRIKHSKLQICSKCHWSSGCFECHYEKALRYHLKKAEPAWLQKKQEELQKNHGLSGW